MKVSWNILRQMIKAPKKVSAAALAQQLTMSVVEVEGWEDQAHLLDKVVVGLVIKVRPHPNADKLKLATVDVGKKQFEVVCGGVNLHEKMKVAFAYPGARVRWHGQGDLITLVTAKIRGVESKGMACVALELDIPDSHALEHGIMDLSYLKAEPGTPLAEALGRNDVILEIDNKSITHRPDLWGHLGLARELAALWKVNLKLPKVAELKPGGRSLKVEIKDTNLCSRYLGVVLENIKVAPSPPWLKNRVEAIGMRSINNIVDAANYVMLELGQPLHTFALKKLASPKIIVRRAKLGETIKTLDGLTRQLTSEMLVIADEKKPLAIAGVIGGEDSEVANSTTSLVVESATFDAVSIRTIAAKLGLRTEASARFEKALDPNLAELGIKRFVEVMKQLNPAVQVVSDLIDEYPTKQKSVLIKVSPAWISERLGTAIKASEIKDILERLGFRVEGAGDRWQVHVPSWRSTRDVTIKEDLLEEVARIYGYGKIRPNLPTFPVIPPERDRAQELRWKVRELLVGAGWTETLSYSFVGDNDLAKFGLVVRGKQITSELSVELDNPTDQSRPWLRPTLLPKLLKQVGDNSHRRDEVRLFELGRVFVSEPGSWRSHNQGERLPKQPYHLGLALGKSRQDKFETFRTLKGVIELIGQNLGVDFSFSHPSGTIHYWYEPAAAVDILVDKLVVGHLGVVQSELCTRLDLPEATVAAELSLDALPVKEHLKSVEPLLMYPEVVRDLSIVVPSGVSWSQVEKELVKASPLLVAVEPFDVYTAKRSLAFHLTFRSPERTLKSEEVDKIIESVKQSLITKFKVEIRDH